MGLVMTMAKVDGAPRESSRGSAKFFSPLHKRFEAFLSVLHFISKSPATMPSRIKLMLHLKRVGKRRY